MEKDPRKPRRGYFVKPGSKLKNRLLNLKKRHSTENGIYMPINYHLLE